MPRQTIGSNKASGESRKFEFKHSEQERADAESVLQPGENLAEFTRSAWKYLIAKRRRDAKKVDNAQ